MKNLKLLLTLLILYSCKDKKHSPVFVEHSKVHGLFVDSSLINSLPTVYIHDTVWIVDCDSPDLKPHPLVIPDTIIYNSDE